MSNVIEIESSDDEVTEVFEDSDVHSSQLENYKNIIGSANFTSDFLTFIKMCYSSEASEGMDRIITRNIVPNYIRADQTYIEGKRFKKYILNILRRMKDDPRHKFSHMKEVCDHLKLHKFKRRVDLITLDTEVSESLKRTLPQKESKKRPRLENATIDVDKSDPIISLDDEPEDTIVLDDEKENNTVNRTNKETVYCISNEKNNNVQEIINSPDILANNEMKDELNKKVKEIEDKIATVKKEIKRLEEMEVTDDGPMSPYIMCDRLKLIIVSLYKDLCQYKGEDYRTRRTRQVHLKTAEGHPEAPAKELELWLNSHTQENGDPVFPDFVDVVRCVTSANERENLGWSRKLVLHEARLLFTKCGEALQERRKRREWRDLVLKVENAEEDPAEVDLELKAKLEANKRIAAKMEADIIEHYVKLENNSWRPRKSNTTSDIKISDVISLAPDSGSQSAVIYEGRNENVAFENGNENGAVYSDGESIDKSDVNNVSQIEDYASNIGEKAMCKENSLRSNIAKNCENRLVNKINNQNQYEISWNGNGGMVEIEIDFNKPLNGIVSSSQINCTPKTTGDDDSIEMSDSSKQKCLPIIKESNHEQTETEIILQRLQSKPASENACSESVEVSNILSNNPSNTEKDVGVIDKPLCLQNDLISSQDSNVTSENVTKDIKPDIKLEKEVEIAKGRDLAEEAALSFLSGSGEGISISTRVFDIEDPIVFIDISSSESEESSDEDNDCQLRQGENL